MNFNDFPKELIRKIFSEFLLRDRFQLRSVCRLWSNLVFSDVNHFAIGDYNLANMDRYESMKNYLFCDREIDRLRLLIFMLKNTKHQLKRLKLSFINKEIKNKPDEFNSLLDEMISVLIECRKLTSVYFDYGFRVSKDQFKTIFRHLGPQLVELFCNDDSSLDCFYPLAMKYLDSSKIRKLGIDNRHENIISVDQIIKKFPLLTYFGYIDTDLYFKKKSPFNVQLFNSMPSLTKLNIFFRSHENEIHKNISSSLITSKLISFVIPCFKFYNSCNFENFKSLRHLQIGYLSESSSADIVNHLPQLESLRIYTYESQKIFNCLSAMKNLKVLEFTLFPNEYLEYKINPMLNIKFLLIDIYNIHTLESVEIYKRRFAHSKPTFLLFDYPFKFLDNISTAFPNIECLDFQCLSFDPNNFKNFLSRFSRLRRFRLHTWNSNEIGEKGIEEEEKSNSYEENPNIKQQMKSFCKQNQIEFLWSRYTLNYPNLKHFSIGKFRIMSPRKFFRLNYNFSNSEFDWL